MKFGNRKILMGLAVVTIGAAAEVLSKAGISSAFATVLTGVYAAFAASNASEHWAQKNSESGNIPPAQQVDIAPLQGKLDQVAEAANLGNQGIGYIVDFIKSNKPK